MKKITCYVAVLFAGILLTTSCKELSSFYGVDNIKYVTPQDAKIVIDDLSIPEIDSKHEFTGKYKENTEIKYADYNKYNDPSGAIRNFFEKFPIEFQNNEGKAKHITQKEFQDGCVIPYINGLWLTTDGLLRVPSEEHIKELAKEHMISPNKEISPYCYKLMEEGWPVYYPQQFKNIIEDRLGKAEGIQLIALPEEKPESKPLVYKNGQWENQEHLYNHIGLLYLPNSFIVPGGIFNEMFGWDSYFMIIGLINSAEYILNTPNAQIYTTANGYKKATAKDAYEMFKIAKGMVDNHIFEIYFYGGYILNANRVYTMQRSQPPFLTSEALVVYKFWYKYGASLTKTLDDEYEDIEYYDTLSPFLMADKHRNAYKPPQNYEQWMAREVFPAALAFFEYYTNPNTVYNTWSPFDAQDISTAPYKYSNVDANPNSNKRVVSVSSPNGGDLYQTSRYYTDGEGPCPEVVFSASPGNRALYNPNFTTFFKSSPIQNPKEIYYNPATDELTGWFYKNDRAVRASGFDLSQRYGNAGQRILDYSPVALNSLLYQMAEDIMIFNREINPQNAKYYGITKNDLTDYINKIFYWKENIKKYLNEESWDAANSCFSDKKTNLMSLTNSVPNFVYPYITGYCPFTTNAADTKKYNVKTNKEPFIPSNLTVAKFQEILDNQNIQKIYGVTTSFHDTDGATQWDFPVAWAPNEYFAYIALANNKIENTSIAAGWEDSVDMYFALYGIIIEKYLAYNPLGVVKVSTGYAENNAGFGWTNGMYMYFVNNPNTIK